MASNRQLNERELREAEIKMTGQIPAATVAFIGFRPAPPPTPPANGSPAATSGNGAAPQPPNGH